MDTRSVTADFYPGGKSAISAGGGITSGESGGGSGVPTVPVTQVAELPERYRESDMASKINEIARVISGGVALIAAMVSFAAFGQVQIQGVRNADLWNDDFVVTNVTVNLDAYARATDVSSATNALADAVGTRLAAATNAVLSAAAYEISNATNELARSIDEKVEASTNGTFDATMLEDYAKRGWVEAQGYLKETNMNSYAQVVWVQDQGYIRKREAQDEITKAVDGVIAMQDQNAAYRLVTPDRLEWVDATGVCWRVEHCCEIINRATMKVKYNEVPDQNGIINTWTNDYLSIELAYFEDVGFVLNGVMSPWSFNITGVDTNLPSQTIIWQSDGYAIQEEMRFWVETNVVDYIAKKDDVRSIVKSIVTNEVETEGWVFSDGNHYELEVRTIDYGSGSYSKVYTFDWGDYDYYPGKYGTVYAQYDYKDYEESNPSTLTFQKGDASFLPENGLSAKWVKITTNVLGLATLKNIANFESKEGIVKIVDDAFFTVTNKVANIVTNDVLVEASDWSFVAYHNSYFNEYITQILRENPPTMTWAEGVWTISELPMCVVPPNQTNDSFKICYTGHTKTTQGDQKNEYVWFSGAFVMCDYEDHESHIVDVDVTATRKVTTKNELGLARIKDIENLPTYEAVTNTAREVSKGLVYDYYLTNSVYFIDDVVPTLKYFSPYIRSMYAPNRITAVEIGDQTQVLVTHNAQVNGNLAVSLPGNIRFMSTLDRNAPYDQGRSLTLQDYLDAFNPVLVPETLRLFQTNRSDYSVGKMVAHDGLEVNGEGKNLFRVSANEANFMDVLTVDPDGDSHLYQVSGKFLTDVNGFITNTYAEGGYATPDPLTKVNGNMYVDKSVAVSSNLTVWGKMFISSWDALRVGWGSYRGAIDKGADAGYQDTIEAYVSRLVQPLVDATNLYYEADAFYDVTGDRIYNKNGRPMYQWIPVGTDGRKVFILSNKGNFNVKFTSSFPSTDFPAYDINNHTVRLKLGPQGESFSEIRVIFDATGVSVSNYVDIGTFNFKGMAPPDNTNGNGMYLEGSLTTLYSSVEPQMRTEYILRQEIYTYDNWVWDDEIGDYIIDPDEPTITEVYEWYDEVTYDMIWCIEPGTCWDYKFQRVGDTGLKVDITRIYKTQPYAGE